MEIRQLRYSDEKVFIEGLSFWEGEDLSWYTFSWKEGMCFKSHVDQLDKESKGEGLPEGWVPSTMLYAFVKDEIIGRINIRHTLNENLLKRGGHIGYAVAPQFRKRGYATKMLKEGLRYSKEELKLSKVLISCASSNVPSIKLIEASGGVLGEETYDDVDDEMIKKYWVQL